MEDGVTETDFLVSPMDNHHVSRGDEEQERNRRDKAEGEEERKSGLIKSIISNLVSGRSENEEEEDDDDREKSGVVISEGKDGGNKGGGLLNHLIANFVSPLNNKTSGEDNEGKAGDIEVKAEEKSSVVDCKSEEDLGGGSGGGGGGGGGGIINNLISNIFHHAGTEGGEKEGREKENVEVVGGSGKEKTGEEGGEGSIIDHIVSHFPTSLADDTAPATDEASILIHSIVHD